MIEFPHVAWQNLTQKQLMIFSKIKPPTILHIFNFTSDVHNKITIFLQIHIERSQYHPESTIFEDMRRKSHGQPTIKHETHIPIQRKLPEIMKMTVSWKRFNNRIEGDFEKASLFGNIVCCVFYLIVGVI